MDKLDVYSFMRKQDRAVLATVTKAGLPEAALVEVAITPDLEIVFDTIDITRKCENLRNSPHIAFVFSQGAQTIQYEGIADEPHGQELERIKTIYFSACPLGMNREGWPGLTYFRVRPKWIRLSNYFRPRLVEELQFAVQPGPREKKGRFPFSLIGR